MQLVKEGTLRAFIFVPILSMVRKGPGVPLLGSVGFRLHGKGLSSDLLKFLPQI